jgi:hypothetical protein
VEHAGQGESFHEACGQVPGVDPSPAHCPPPEVHIGQGEMWLGQDAVYMLPAKRGCVVSGSDCRVDIFAVCELIKKKQVQGEQLPGIRCFRRQLELAELRECGEHRGQFHGQFMDAGEELLFASTKILISFNKNNK